MNVKDLLAQCELLGVTLAPGTNGTLRVSPPGVLPDELRTALIVHKPELLVHLASHRHDGSCGDTNANAVDSVQWPAVAVRVWSDMLQEAIWIVADHLPRAKWPTDAPVYSHAEVKMLTRVGPDTLEWVHATKQMFGAQVIATGRRTRAHLETSARDKDRISRDLQNP
jgi:TubC N-terminal docking domain